MCSRQSVWTSPTRKPWVEGRPSAPTAAPLSGPPRRTAPDPSEQARPRQGGSEGPQLADRCADSQHIQVVYIKFTHTLSWCVFYVKHKSTVARLVRRARRPRGAERLITDDITSTCSTASVESRMQCAEGTCEQRKYRDGGFRRFFMKVKWREGCFLLDLGIDLRAVI